MIYGCLCLFEEAWGVLQWHRRYLGLPTCAQLLLCCQKLCFLTQRRLFSPAGSFQCLHTLASIKIAKRCNLPSKRRNLPAKRRFFLAWFRAGLTASAFSPKEPFFQQPAQIIAVLGNGVNFTCWKVQVCQFCFWCPFKSLSMRTSTLQAEQHG